MKTDLKTLADLYNPITDYLKERVDAESRLKTKLEATKQCGGRALKSNEITAWLGELAVAVQLRGQLTPLENASYDVITDVPPRRISIKARRRKPGTSSWRRSSLMPRSGSEAEEPTHLAFVVLREDYQLERIHLFPWDTLTSADLRNKKQGVPEAGRYFYLSRPREQMKEFIIY